MGKQTAQSAATVVSTNPEGPRALTAAPAAATNAEAFANWTSFTTRPFPAASRAGDFEWTAEDGTDTNVMLQLAHNPSEYRRMSIENETIFRRQLVYFNEGFVPMAQRAVQTGTTPAQVTLPGLDGQQFAVNVTRADFRDGGNRGKIYGQFPGRPDSMVTLAFNGRRQAFTIISSRDGIYLQAESREPGEVVVKQINPKTYGQLPKAGHE